MDLILLAIITVIFTSESSEQAEKSRDLIYKRLHYAVAAITASASGLAFWFFILYT